MRYNVTGWLEKNKDPLNDTAVNVLKNSKNNQLILDIWANYQTQEERAQEEKRGGEFQPFPCDFYEYSQHGI